MIRSLVSRATSLIAIRVFGAGVAVLVTVLIARFFGSEALGAYSFAVVLTTILGVPIANGWGTMLLRETAHADAVNGQVRAMAKLGAIIAVIVATCATVLALVGASAGEPGGALAPLAQAWLPAILLLGLCLLFDQMSALRMAQLRGLDRPVTGQAPEMLARPLVLCAGVAVVHLAFADQFEIWMLFAALATASAIAALTGQVLYLLAAKPTESAIATSAERKQWFASAGALALSAGLVQLNGYMDILLLGYLETAAEVGIYRTALQIAMLANFGYMALNFLASQRFARARAVGDMQALSATSRNLSRLALLTALQLPIILLTFGDTAFARLFGEEFAPAAGPALLISAGFVVNALLGMPRTMLIMHKREFLVVRSSLCTLGLNVVLCAMLIPSLGLYGAALGNFVASSLWGLLLWFLARREIGVDTSVAGLPVSQSAPKDV